MSDAWIEIGASDDVPHAAARRVTLQGLPIAVFRTSDGSLFAILDRCPHKGGPLSDGMVHGRAVACPLHNWQISLETGKALGEDTGCVRTFDVEETAGRVRIRLAALASHG